MTPARTHEVFTQPHSLRRQTVSSVTGAKLLFPALMCLLCLSTATAFGQQATMEVIVDARELPRKLLRATIKLATPKATAGSTDSRPALLYPKWIPGIHGPKNPISNLAGIAVKNQDGEVVTWERDWRDVYRIFLNSPSQRNVTLQTTYICSQPTVNSKGVDSYGFSNLGVINWNTILFYPEGIPVSEIEVRAGIILPEGWSFGSALHERSRAGDTVFFKAGTLENFVDKPLICGANFRTVKLADLEHAEYFLHMVADDAGDLPREDSLLNPLRNVVKEAEALFGGAHFSEYHYLLVLSSKVGRTGLEHRNSSFNSVKANEFRNGDWEDKQIPYLLTHEFVHAWCGKYRRPVGMYTRDFMQPKDTDLLWVYEGMTQYLGNLLAVRSGFVTEERYKENLASNMGGLMNQRGRQWRPLRDTEISGYTLRGGSRNWSYLRRGQDYYREGAALALEFDARIRTLSDGKRSLEDFCREFFTKGGGAEHAAGFDLAEVEKALLRQAEFNWDSLIQIRVYQTQERFDPEVIRQIGYRLTYTPETPKRIKRFQRRHKFGSFLPSLGFTIGSSGKIGQVTPDSPADDAGLYTGVEVIGVEGKKFTVRRLEDAVRSSVMSGEVNLLTLNGDTFESVTIKYDAGLRYYTLTPDEERHDLLKKIIEPLVKR
jgi:predicted metalloprotease with PDZ domain